MADKICVLDLNAKELEEMVVGWGWPKFRAAQVLEWIYTKLVSDWSAMTNLSLLNRQWCADRLDIYRGQRDAELVSTDRTLKFLLRWPKGHVTETVIIPEEERRTVCVSVQVGCPVGCTFCASGAGGFGGNLAAGQIVEQALWAARDLLPENTAITNMVFMGVGEPLLNYDNVILAVRAITSPWGLGLSPRRVTISTVGIPARIRQLAEEGLPLNLALSLHAPNDELRAELIPWTGRAPIAECLEALRYYFDRTHRETTIEYVLLDGVNSTLEHARELVRLLTPIEKWRCNVNLICYNGVSGKGYRPPHPGRCKAFLECLRQAGINAHVRPSKGGDIAAACGQLRRLAAQDAAPKAEEANTTVAAGEPKT